MWTQKEMQPQVDQINLLNGGTRSEVKLSRSDQLKTTPEVLLEDTPKTRDEVTKIREPRILGLTGQNWSFLVHFIYVVVVKGSQ